MIAANLAPNSIETANHTPKGNGATTYLLQLTKEQSRTYGFSTRITTTAHEAQRYANTIQRLKQMETQLNEGCPTEIAIAKAMMVDPALRPVAITIRRSTENLINAVIDDRASSTMIGRMIKKRTMRQHERGNTANYFNIRSLALTLTSHNIRRLISAVKSLSNEQFNELLKKSSATA